jgi:hypothetical protein
MPVRILWSLVSLGTLASDDESVISHQETGGH